MTDQHESSAPEESFISHLVELRDRLLRSLIAVGAVLGLLCLYPGPGEIYDLLAAPLTNALPEGVKMVAIGVITPFMVPLKVTAMVAFVLALPFILYQVWSFIAPGLYAHEKRLGIPLIVSSSLLFLMGMAFCYFFVFGQVFHFINSFAPKSITPAPDIEAYLSFVMTMFLAFGLAFEVPVALVVMVKLGVVTVEKLKAWRSYFVVGAFVVAAVVTPPDVVSQLALAIPMCLLYEVGILAARLVSRPAEEEMTPAQSGFVQAAAVSSENSAEMNAEMDKADAEFRKLTGK
jgi:sec-independent protein translocase protein TatC